MSMREVIYKKVRLEPHQRCPKCGYDWMTKGQLQSITCPNCRHVFKRTGELARS